MIYLAGPFFNAVQKAWAERIADFCRDNSVEHYAPVRHGIKLDSPAKADHVYRDNVANLLQAKAVLVQTDWLMPEGLSVRAVDEAVLGLSAINADAQTYRNQHEAACKRASETTKGQVKEPILFHSPPLNVPDSGSIWELGYACAVRDYRKNLAPTKISLPQVVVYSVYAGKMNLMLAKSADGYLQGEDAVFNYLRNGEIQHRKFLGEAV